MASILRDSYRASLLYDGVLVFSQAIKNIYEERDMLIPDVDCRDSEASYEQGQELLDELNKVRPFRNVYLNTFGASSFYHTCIKRYNCRINMQYLM